jgi:hypothetical protein
VIVSSTTEVVYLSRDGGSTWQSSGSPAIASGAVAVSGDGTRVYAGKAASGALSSYSPTGAAITATTTGALGFLEGGQYTTASLQFIGGGQFLLTSSTGTLYGN